MTSGPSPLCSQARGNLLNAQSQIGPRVSLQFTVSLWTRARMLNLEGDAGLTALISTYLAFVSCPAQSYAQGKMQKLYKRYSLESEFNTIISVRQRRWFRAIRKHSLRPGRTLLWHKCPHWGYDRAIKDRGQTCVTKNAVWISSWRGERTVLANESLSYGPYSQSTYPRQKHKVIRPEKEAGEAMRVKKHGQERTLMAWETNGLTQ